MQTCRIRGNAEVRPPNVTRTPTAWVRLLPNGKPHLFFVFVFYLNSHSNLECKHINKKDRFADLGKSLHRERFVLRWDVSPPFPTFSSTRILCISRKSINYDKTTAKQTLTNSRVSSKWS